MVVRKRSAGETNRETASARLLRNRSGSGNRNKLAELENGALEEMAQGGGHPTITVDRGKQLRFQEQLLFELLGVFAGNVASTGGLSFCQGATTSFNLGLT